MNPKSSPKRIPTTVTFLEMTARPTMPPPPQPPGKNAMLLAEDPPIHFYRYLYDAVGRGHYWVERHKLEDEALTAYLTDPQVQLYVLYVDGCPAGMSELDLRNPSMALLAYFGLIPDYIGRRLGHYFLYQTVLNAWASPIDVLRVNTCTLDHPRALPLYQRVGFTAYAREERYIVLP